MPISTGLGVIRSSEKVKSTRHPGETPVGYHDHTTTRRGEMDPDPFMDVTGTKSRPTVVPPPIRSSARTSSPPVLVPAGTVRTAFQPIVSIRTGHAWGLEALTRAVEPATGRIIPPLLLFAEAEEDGLLGAFDRYCRRIALETFGAVAHSTDAVLSLNWDVRTLGTPDHDPDQFLRVAERQGVPPERIVIEVLEERASDLDALVRFVSERRAEGFLIAVDDYGTGHSTPERLVRLEPDIVKIDRALVHGVGHSTPRRETCRTIAELARGIGAIVIAEGVETDQDLAALSMMGIELVQGFVFARPGFDVTAVVAEAERSVAERREFLRTSAANELVRRRAMRAVHDGIVAAIAHALRVTPVGTLQTAIDALAASIAGVEAIYVLDSSGVQLTPTRFAPGAHPKRGFRPTTVGSDLALKDYFLEVSFGDGSFSTRPYVSMASGRACITHARKVDLVDGTSVVLCCDLPETA